MLRDVRNGVRYFADGREACEKTAQGRAEYVRRRAIAWHEQRGLCAICQQWVALEEATLDHIAPRGMNGARRDDRQENLQMLCWRDNTEKGSRRA